MSENESSVILENCSFTSAQVKQIKRKREYFIEISLPLTENGYKYSFVHRKEKTQEKFTSQWFLQQVVNESDIFLSEFYNNLKDIAVISLKYEFRDYVKNILRENLGQTIIGGSFTISEDKTFSVDLNSFFPTITYDIKRINNSRLKFKRYRSRSHTLESKNIPMKILMFKMSKNCSYSETKKNLIILLKYAATRTMKNKVSFWTSLENNICKDNIVVHSYPQQIGDVIFLILENSTKCNKYEDFNFPVFNQRKDLYDSHRLGELNKTLNFSLIFRCVRHSSNEIRSKNLMQWLYIR